MSPTNVPDSVRARVREAAGDRCGYCLSPQRLPSCRFLFQVNRDRTMNAQEKSPLLGEGLGGGRGSVITFLRQST